MGSSRVQMKLAFAVVLVCILVAAPYVDAAISCPQAVGYVLPCMNYLRTGGRLPPPCCTRLKSLNAAAKTIQDRKAVCECFKAGLRRHPGLRLPLINSLPSRCGINIRYNFSPSFDCSKVK